MTQFKDKVRAPARTTSTLGLLTYPVLQAADILLYGATRVPVGEDQRQHLELAREIVRRFNARFGETFAEPQPLFSTTPKILGLDGQAKMSKSLGNTIALAEPETAIWDKLRAAATDPARVKRTDPGTPEKCNIFTLHKFFSDDAQQAAVHTGCTTAGIGCIDCKKMLFEGVKTELAQIRARADALRADPARVDAILARGAAEARKVAAETMKRVRERLGLLHGAAHEALRGGGGLLADRGLASVGLAAGCGARDDGSSPEAAVRSLIATARAGDRGAVYDRLGPRTRAHIDGAAGRRPTGPAARACCAPPTWSPSAGCRRPGSRPARACCTATARDADVEVYSATGDRQTVHTVREGKSWKVELPLR